MRNASLWFFRAVGNYSWIEWLWGLVISRLREQWTPLNPQVWFLCAHLFLETWIHPETCQLENLSTLNTPKISRFRNAMKFSLVVARDPDKCGKKNSSTFSFEIYIPSKPSWQYVGSRGWKEDPLESTRHTPIQDKFNVKLNVKLNVKPDIKLNVTLR